MKPITRELMSGTAAVAALGGTVVSGMVPLAACIAAGGLVYAGLRMFLPVERAQTRATERETILADSTRRLAAFNHQVQQIPPGPFQTLNRDLTDILQQIIRRASDFPDQIELDDTFPARIGQLMELLQRYCRIVVNANRTNAAQSAIEHTEQVFGRATDGFRRLLAQQIDKDAVRLKVDARVYDELLNIQTNLEEVDLLE